MPVSAPTASDSNDHHHAHPRAPLASHGPAESGSPIEALAQLDHVAVGATRSILESVRGPVINLAVWQRRLPVDVAREIDAAGHESFAYIDERFDVSESANIVASWLGKSRLTGSLIAWLAGDIEALIKETARLGGTDRVRLKIETIVDTKCGRFHSDMTLLRLISAYHGAGTEFVPDAIADDVFLHDRMPLPEQIVSAPPESVCLLRGAMAADGFSDRAIVHRSPDIHRPEDWRLLVTVDALVE